MSMAAIGLTPKSKVTFLIETLAVDSTIRIVKRKQVFTLEELNFTQLDINKKNFEANLEEVLRDQWAYNLVNCIVTCPGDLKTVSNDTKIELVLYFGAQQVDCYVNTIDDALRGQNLDNMTVSEFKGQLAEWANDVSYDYYHCRYVFGDILPNEPTIIPADERT